MVLATVAGFVRPPSPYREPRTHVRRLLVHPVLVPLLAGKTTDQGFSTPDAAALINRFIEGLVVTVSQKHPPKAELKKMVGVDEVWTICSRRPKPGWRLLGRFLEQDFMVLLHAVHRADLDGDAFNRAIEQWDRAFPNRPPLRSSDLGDYLSGQYDDLDR